MRSSWSKLESWLRRRLGNERPGEQAGTDQLTPGAEPGPLEPSAPVPAAERRVSADSPGSQQVGPAPRPAPAGEPGQSGPPELDGEIPTIRLGLDFGTTTTLVAARIGEAPPRIIRLEEPNGWLPSFYWESHPGIPVFGAAAQGQPDSVHSIKLKLRDDRPLEPYGVRPSELAFRVISEAVRLVLGRLQAERVLPATATRLDIMTNVGCTPAFTLDQRALLRDICRKAGLDVTLVNLVVEPIAAAFELIRSGVLGGLAAQRILVVDAGGGTLDIAVMAAVPGRNVYTLYATSGHDDVGGDAFTTLIDQRLREELETRVGAPGVQAFSSADDALIWQRAENAKIVLSSRRSVQVALAGLAGLTEGTLVLTREWFEAACGPLLTRFMFHVTNTYRLARLVLDRGGPGDASPGTALLECRPPLFEVKYVTDLELSDDGREHLDAVFLVGGASQLPALQRRFRELFGSKLLEPELLGLEPVTAVVLGLARHEPIEALELRYPAWQVGVSLDDGITDDGNGPIKEVQLYEPFASTFAIGASLVSWYTTELPLPSTTSPLTAALTFRQVGRTAGTAWPPRPVPPGTSGLVFRMSLLGDIDLHCSGGEPLYPDKPAAPWKPPGIPISADWLPRHWSERSDVDTMPWFDPANDGPG